MPAAEIEIAVSVARSLIDAQFPRFATLAIAPFAHGWDNEIFALGGELLVRMPRRETAVPLIENERHVELVAPHCTLPVPELVERGRPGPGYPYPWSIVRRLPGEPVGDQLLDAGNARVLGRFVRSLHVPAPASAPRNPLRGVPLIDRQARFDSSLAALGDRVDRGRIRAAWDRALTTPAWSAPPVWLHGDLHSYNVLWDRARITGVIDFGDITAGDPATDLMIAFVAFGDREREVFLVETGADADTIERARGWAIALGLVFAASDDPALSALGLRAIAAAQRR